MVTLDDKGINLCSQGDLHQNVKREKEENRIYVIRE